jgi:hypothetical protein
MTKAAFHFDIVDPFSFDFWAFATCADGLVDKVQRLGPAPFSPSRPLADCVFRDADVSFRHVEAVLLDIV